jgi:hypothetical protein
MPLKDLTFSLTPYLIGDLALSAFERLQVFKDNKPVKGEYDGYKVTVTSLSNFLQVSIKVKKACNDLKNLTSEMIAERITNGDAIFVVLENATLKPYVVNGTRPTIAYAFKADKISLAK